MFGSIVSKEIWVGKAGAPISLGAVVTAALMLALLVAAGPARSDPSTFTVNSTDDIGDAALDGTCDANAAPGEQCTLRAAIEEANNTSDADTINFNIPSTDCNATSGVCTITVGSSPTASGQSLPDITQPVTIDGYTQGDATADPADDAKENTILVARDGTDAKPLIELNGANVTAPSSSHNGLAISASNVVVRGLVINRFTGTGIFIFGSGAGGAKIEGNFIGTNPSGTPSSVGNGTGVTAFGGGANIIGGRAAAAHNLISGNFHGLTISSNAGNMIQGNLIGTTKDGMSNLGNSTEGVAIASSNNVVGSAAADNDLDSNLIAFNGDEGILISDGTGNRILNNRIYTNGKLGINLAGGKENIDGVTKNDGRAKDRDTGANYLQNFPVISSARTEGSTTTIKGTLKSRPKQTFIIQIFSSSPSKDSSGFGEGKEFLSQVTKRTNREGTLSFSFPIGDIRGAFVTATATRLDPTTLMPADTSEFSAAKKVT